MLSDHERRVLDEFERQFAAQAQESGGPGPVSRPPRRWNSHQPAGRAVVMVGCLAAILLITGAANAALALIAAAALGWSLWRFWPQLHDDGVITVSEKVPDGPARAASRPRPGGEWLSRYLKGISEVQ
ncbi:hypothetical protein SAMN05661080_02655 [Modestobacter sp. DSM 44400]|uniref:DUF3040 domain-containing protein n=1 Tax=Modestobacter sp. DSM 44400 TaxID=1550230 RepID=UPI00089C285B|nr:DUF3040 domain-containing protein [Modestobacter sp. DSM 44400]SDY20070.1 hypothetical protein SAMN05661080_02655 [Modestobacter sp. DSM 44400]